MAYLEYQDCETDDCFAEKGVGFVRIRNPETNERYNVAFIHMQASYPPETIEDAKDIVIARALQLLDVKKIFEGSLTALQLTHEPLFFMGDLNIDGDLEDADLGFEQVHKENLYEYNHRFTSLSPVYEFFWGQLRDAWANYNSPKPATGRYDRGITNISAWGTGFDGARLDYIFKATKDRRCSQHMSLTHNLRWSPPGGIFIETGMGPNGVGQGGIDELSDHYGINMDVNLTGPYCSPAIAYDVFDTFPSLGPGETKAISGNIALPGSIQWYKFNRVGTFSFAVASSTGAEFRIYQGKDLTTPASQFKELTSTLAIGRVEIEAKVFHVNEPPFYVRVYNPDRTKIGSYALVFEEHDCSNKEFACGIKPAEARHHKMNLAPSLVEPDEAWFVLGTECDSGSVKLQKMGNMKLFYPDRAIFFPDQTSIRGIYLISG